MNADTNIQQAIFDQLNKEIPGHTLLVPQPNYFGEGENELNVFEGNEDKGPDTYPVKQNSEEKVPTAIGSISAENPYFETTLSDGLKISFIYNKGSDIYSNTDVIPEVNCSELGAAFILDKFDIYKMTYLAGATAAEHATGKELVPYDSLCDADGNKLNDSVDTVRAMLAFNTGGTLLNSPSTPFRTAILIEVGKNGEPNSITGNFFSQEQKTAQVLHIGAVGLGPELQLIGSDLNPELGSSLVDITANPVRIIGSAINYGKDGVGLGGLQFSGSLDKTGTGLQFSYTPIDNAAYKESELSFGSNLDIQIIDYRGNIKGNQAFIPYVSTGKKAVQQNLESNRQ